MINMAKKQTVDLKNTGYFYDNMSNKVIYWEFNQGGGKVVVGFGDKKPSK